MLLKEYFIKMSDKIIGYYIWLCIFLLSLSSIFIFIGVTTYNYIILISGILSYILSYYSLIKFIENKVNNV